jgi:hypothetical protein
MAITTLIVSMIDPRRKSEEREREREGKRKREIAQETTTTTDNSKTKVKRVGRFREVETNLWSSEGSVSTVSRYRSRNDIVIRLRRVRHALNSTLYYQIQLRDRELELRG